MRKILFIFAAMLLSSIGLQAQPTVIPHPFTVGIDGEDQPYVIYFTAGDVGKDTWKSTYADGQRLLTKDEWDYLLNTRSINSIAAPSFRGWAQRMDGEDKVTNAYAVLLPDDWAEMYHFNDGTWYKDEELTMPFFNIGSTFDSNTLNAADITALQQAGAVFLSCDITAEEGTFANGQYWTGTRVEGNGIYFTQFSSSATTPDEQAISIVGGGVESELRYVLLAQEEVTITMDEKVNNADLLQPWATHHKPVNVQLIRSLTPGMYNTLCLPFDLTAGEVKTAFGETAKLAKFRSGTLSEDKRTLNIDFEEINLSDGTAIEAGVAYLIEPSQPVTNPTFANRVIKQTTAAGENFSPSDVIAYLGIINPHQLAAGNRKYLFLQANNTLTWSKADDTSTMKGMRGYFYVPAMADMPASCPARLSVRPAAQIPTGEMRIENGEMRMNGKYIINGQFVIIKDGKNYNAVGFEL